MEKQKSLIQEELEKKKKWPKRLHKKGEKEYISWRLVPQLITKAPVPEEINCRPCWEEDKEGYGLPAPLAGVPGNKTVSILEL